MSQNANKWQLPVQKHVVPVKPTTPVVVGAANPDAPWQSRHGKKPMDAVQQAHRVPGGKPLLTVATDGELPTSVFQRAPEN